MGNVPRHVLFRLLRPGTDKGSYNSSTNYNVGDVVLYGGTYYVCKKAGSGYRLGVPGSSSYWEASWFSIEIARPKLEVGATMTEWTEKRADMVDKRALLATGIDIDSKKITLTADNTTFRTNNGDTIAMFDRNGINASLVNANRLEALSDNSDAKTVINALETTWYSSNGNPGIAIGYDASGVPHLRFYDKDGVFMYDLGPSGLRYMLNSVKPASAEPAAIAPVSGSLLNSTVDVYDDSIGSTKTVYVMQGKVENINAHTSGKYIFHARKDNSGTVPDYAEYDGCVIESDKIDNLTENDILREGWYATEPYTFYPDDPGGAHGAQPIWYYIKGRPVKKVTLQYDANGNYNGLTKY